MYKLNYFNFEEKNNKYLITNDIGEYEFLSKENFKKLLQKMKLESNVEENLLKKGFIFCNSWSPSIEVQIATLFSTKNSSISFVSNVKFETKL